MHAPLRRLTNACYGSGACFLYDYDAGSNQAYGYLLSDPVTVTANTQYDLYAYVRGEMDSRDSEGGWIVRAYYYDSGGNGQGYQSVASGGAGTISDTWRLRGGRLTTLTNTATLRVALFNYMTSGWAAFDDVSLSPVLTDTGLATTTIRHAYDPLQRLTTATYSGATTYTFAYTYDAVGNRTVQTQTITSTLVTTYTYDAANRLTNINGQAYTWDNNGNLTNDGSKVYTYTQANRLTAVSGTGLSWSATYNGDGARLKQVVNSVPTTYTQDLASPLPVVLQAQTGTTATLYLFDVGTRPLAEYDSAWEYLLPDGLGSVRQLVDAGGNVKLTEAYEPYGSVLSSQGSATSAFGFTGEQLDSYIELLYLRARYMQPALGMFLSHDPLEGNIQRAGSLNGLNYVEGNPVNLIDSSGMWTAYVQNSDPIGLALRTFPAKSAAVIKRMSDGTMVWVVMPGTVYDQRTIWQHVVDVGSSDMGWAAEWDNGIQYLTQQVPGPRPRPTPQPTPPPSNSGARLIQLPVDNPRYDNGYGYYKWGFHDGYDITSGVPTVYSMGSGKVDSLDTPYAPDVKCAECGANTGNFLIRVQMDAGYFIKYIHIKETRLCKGDRVQAGTVIGDYAEVGDLTPGYPHVHVGFENPKYQSINPGDYWPGSAPTQWTFGNPSDKPVQQ